MQRERQTLNKQDTEMIQMKNKIGEKTCIGEGQVKREQTGEAGEK